MGDSRLPDPGFLGLIHVAGRWQPENGDVTQQNAIAVLLFKLHHGEFEYTQK